MRVFLPLVCLLLALGSGGCHRNLEPYSDEPVSEPDLSRIFPEGAGRAPLDPGTPMPTPPAPAPPAALAPAAASGSVIAGTIRLAPELEHSVPSGAVLFLIARHAEGGPPVAVRRYTAPVFPLDFAIGPGDIMMEGLAFQGPLRLTARVDADGDAMTRNPGDLQGSSAPELEPGARGVEIVIDEVL